MSDKKVEYEEPISIGVGKIIIANGLYIADSFGTASSLDRTNEIGILLKNPNMKPRRYLFNLIPEKPRREFIGTIKFNDSGASEQKWIFEVYGNKYVGLAQRLSEDLALIFDVRIIVILVREHPKVEIFPSEYNNMCM